MPKTTRAARRRPVPALLAAALIALAGHGAGMAGGTGTTPPHRSQARHQPQIQIAIGEHVAGVPCSACGGGV